MKVPYFDVINKLFERAGIAQLLQRQATGWRARFCFPAGVRGFLLYTASRLSLIQWLHGNHSIGVK
jgi:hypothetical protein